VSALSHYLEAEGVPTVAISLIRLHTERIQNPRSLWVPFELGRPIGPPRHADFQLKVMTAALELLVAKDGPVLLADFPEDDPTVPEIPNWVPPFDLSASIVNFNDVAGLNKLFQREVADIMPSYVRFALINARTTVGLSGFDIAAIPSHLVNYLCQDVHPPTDAGTPAVQRLRWAVDDLKAFYLEAMSANSETPSSRQMQAWFWDRTVAAQVIIALRQKLLASDDKRDQAVGRMNLIPGAQVQRKGL
jgi:hypothetical protein